METNGETSTETETLALVHRARREVFKMAAVVIVSSTAAVECRYELTAAGRSCWQPGPAGVSGAA